jgi:hypothetical protein
MGIDSDPEFGFGYGFWMHPVQGLSLVQVITMAPRCRPFMLLRGGESLYENSLRLLTEHGR